MCYNFGYYRSFKVEKVIEASRKTRRGRMMGLDKIPMDFWKFTGRLGLRWLIELCNNIFKMAKMPEVWRWSMMIPLCKSKGDIYSYNNY